MAGYINWALTCKTHAILQPKSGVETNYKSCVLQLRPAYILSLKPKAKNFTNLMRNIQTNDRFVLMVLREAKALASSCILMGWVKMEDIYEPLL